MVNAVHGDHHLKRLHPDIRPCSSQPGPSSIGLDRNTACEGVACRAEVEPAALVYVPLQSLEYERHLPNALGPAITMSEV